MISIPKYWITCVWVTWAYTKRIMKCLRKYMTADKYLISNDIMSITLTSQKSHAVSNHRQLDWFSKPYLDKKVSIKVPHYFLPAVLTYKVPVISECGKRFHNITLSQERIPDSKAHGANMGPIWDLSAPHGPHVGPMNLPFGHTCNNYCLITAEWAF